MFNPDSVTYAELEPRPLHMEFKARNIKLQREFKLYQTSYRPCLLKHLQHVSFPSFTESDTSTPCNEYAKLSKNVQELKKNVSSLKEGSVSRGLYWN